MTAIISYTEEDGYSIEREDGEIRVYGACEGEYQFSHADGTHDEPEENDLEQESFDCWIDSIQDTEGNEVDTELTDDEWEIFKAYMSDCLDYSAEWEML